MNSTVLARNECFSAPCLHADSPQRAPRTPIQSHAQGAHCAPSSAPSDDRAVSRSSEGYRRARAPDLPEANPLRRRDPRRRSRGRLLSLDRFHIEGAAWTSGTAGVSGEHRMQGTLVAAGDAVAPETLLEVLREGLAKAPPAACAAASSLPNRAGAWARLLAADGAELRRAMAQLWTALRARVTGHPPPPARRRKQLPGAVVVNAAEQGAVAPTGEK